MVYRLDSLDERDCTDQKMGTFDIVSRQISSNLSLAKETFARVQKYVGCSGEDKCGLQE